MSPSYIPLDRSRRLRNLVSAVFDIMHAAFKPLIQSVFAIAGPWMFIVGVGGGMMLQSTFLKMGSSADPSWQGATGSLVASTFLTIIGYVVAVISQHLVVLAYLKIYHDEKRAASVAETWAYIKKNWKRLLGAAALQQAVIVLPSLLLFMLVAGVGLMELSFIPFLLMIYLFIPAQMVGCLYVFGGLDARESVRKAFALTRGRWWRQVVVYGALGIVQYIVITPALLILAIAIFLAVFASMEGGMDDMAMPMRIYSAVSAVLFSVLYLVANTFMFVGVVLNYFDALEQDEAPSLAARIENIGAEATQ